MIEFAVVLVVKRKLEEDKDESNGRPDESKLATKPLGINVRRRRVDVINVNLYEGMAYGLKKDRDGEIQQTRSEVKQLGFLKASSVTNKIDLVAFVVFLLGYFIFNCAYCGYYMQH